MIAEDFATSARRAEPQWWFHWGNKQRGDCCKRPARAGRKLFLAFPALPPSMAIVPVQNGRVRLVIELSPVQTLALSGLTMPFCATS